MAWGNASSGLASVISNITSQVHDLIFPPQALAETSPSLYDGYWYANDGIDLVDHHASYAELYKDQPSVNAVVNKRSDLLATLPLRAWDTSPENGNIEITDGPLWDLLQDPTRGEMTRWAFWHWYCSTRDIYGEAFALKRRDENGNVNALTPITPIRTAASRNNDGNVYYTFTLGVASAGILTIPASEVVAWLNFNPNTLMRGMSPLEPLRTTLANEDAARRSNLSFWHRGARPGTVIEHPGELSEKAIAKIRAQYDARHAGVDKTGGTAVLDEGMKIQQVQLTQEEAQYLQSRQLNLNEVCMVYDMPPAAIHALLNQASFTSSVEQLRSLGRDTLPPIVESLSSVLNSQLVSEFDGTQKTKVRFGLDEMLRGDFETLAKVVPGLITSGAITPNQGAAYLGLPLHDDPVADKLYANQATQPLGTPVSRITETVPSPPSPPPVPPLEAIDETASHQELTGLEEQAGSKSISRVSLGISGQIRTKADKQTMLAEAQKAMRKALGIGLGRQSDALNSKVDSDGFRVDDSALPEHIGSDIYDPEDWDEDLAGEIQDASTAVVDAFGKQIAGKAFDVARASAYIAAGVAAAAKGMDQTTAGALLDSITRALDPSNDVADRTQAVVDAVHSVTDDMTGARADEAAQTRTTSLSNFGEHEGAVQSGQQTKTWVTGDNPRASHAAMDGETVGISDTFSNGAKWPGDPSLDTSEIAGCNCSLDFGSDDS